MNKIIRLTIYADNEFDYSQLHFGFLKNYNISDDIIEINKDFGVGILVWNILNMIDLEFFGVDEMVKYVEKELKDGRYRVDLYAKFFGDPENWENPLHIFNIEGHYKCKYLN